MQNNAAPFIAPERVGVLVDDDEAMQQAWEQELEEFLIWQETFGGRDESLSSDRSRAGADVTGRDQQGPQESATGLSVPWD
jgi:hypothetical protein